MLAVTVPVLMGACFALLGRTFSYPAIMDRPAPDVLTRLGREGDDIVGYWLGVTLAAALFVALVVRLDGVLREDCVAGNPLARRLPWLSVVTAVGVLAAVSMMLDLSQWVWLYPDLGRRYVDPAATAGVRTDLEIMWFSFHRYVGVGIGVYAATLFNGLWALGVGWLLLAGRRRDFLPWLAVLSGGLFLLSIAPFVGFDGYGTINSAGFVVWGLWLVISGWRLFHTGRLWGPYAS